MRILYAATRAVTALLIFSAGAAVVLGLTQYLITSQHLGEAHALKAWTIAGGIVAGGAFLPFMHGKARVLLVLGILSAEAFNIGMITETTWRERAAAHAERQQAHARDLEAYQGRVKARDDAETRLARAEAAADQKEQARAADASKRDCKRECMAGHLEAVTAARAEVTAARTALAAAPLPGVPPSLEADTGAGQPPLGQYWDLTMAVLGSIGGNLIAIGLFAFAGTVASRQPATGNRQGLPAACPLPAATLPTITVADVSAADAVLLQAENDRALASFRASVAHPATARGASVATEKAADKPLTMLPADSELSGLAGLFGGEQPEPAANVVRLFSRLPDRSPDGSGGPKGGRKVRPAARANDRKADVLADIQARIDRGERFASQEDLRAALAERFGPIAKSSLSDWLGELSGSIVRRQDGRRKVVG